MKIVVKKDYQELSREAAEIVKKRIQAKPDIVLGLPTGSTPLGLYKELARAYKKEELDFSQVSSFNLDEYFGLEASHPQSYHFYMEKNFFSLVNIRKENVFIPDGKTSDLENHCQCYEEKIKERGGIDLQILGIGRNGHIGFNEPGSSFNSRTRLVRLAQETIEDNSRFFKSLADVPTRAITMGLATIMESKDCLLLASGQARSERISRALKGPVSPDFPGSILQKHRNLTVILDKEAASFL